MLFISIDDSSHQSAASDAEPDRRKKRVLIDVVDEPNNDRFGMFAIVTD
jgi:hypothetical protein